MMNRASIRVRRVVQAALWVTLLSLGVSTGARAAGVSDAELRGYKGGLIEISLKDGETVRGMLYGYTGSHLELEVANDRTVKLHRSWVSSLKAAPAGSVKSRIGAFPRNAGDAYSPGAVTPRETPRETPPPRETPRDTPPDSRPTSRPPTTAPTPSAPGPGIDKGLVFQLRVGGNMLTFLGNAISSWLNSSFLFGYKMGKLVIGLGVEMSYSNDNYPNADPDPIESSVALVLFQPTLEYYLATKGPLALFLTGGLHIGFVNAHADPGKDVTDPMIGFHAGIGMRYFFHARWAMGVEGGLRGAWMMIEDDDTINTDDNHTGVMSLYGALTLTAIW